MKKIFEYLGLISLMVISFFLTDKTITVIQEVDEIMISIRENADNYEEASVNAIIDGDTIIPGRAGRRVNVENSYRSMQRIGIYDSDFLEFDIIVPEISITNNLDKYIVQGNANKRMISLVLIVEENQVEEIINFVGDNKVTFAVNNMRNIDVVNAIDSEGHGFIISSTEDYSLFMQQMNNRGSNVNFCHNPNRQLEFLKQCQQNGQHTILGDSIISVRPLQVVRDTIEPGSILIFRANAAVLRELPNIISYINFRGFAIETLDNHLREN